jgi:protein CpxP
MTEPMQENNMKFTAPLFALALALSSPLFAVSEEPHTNDPPAQVMSHNMMGMMDPEQMAKMQAHMQSMQTQMADIKAETDPQKRQQLMQHHMDNMQQGMSMMLQGMGKMKGANMDKVHPVANMNMEERMSMMENRTSMMQMMMMMMEQMMDHLAEEDYQ